MHTHTHDTATQGQATQGLEAGWRGEGAGDSDGDSDGDNDGDSDGDSDPAMVTVVVMVGRGGVTPKSKMQAPGSRAFPVACPRETGVLWMHC